MLAQTSVSGQLSPSPTSPHVSTSNKLDIGLTSCGSKWYQRLGLQFFELEQSAGEEGYSFNTVCKAHDTCYGSCGISKMDCDKKLLAEAEEVCMSIQNTRKKSNCIADAQIFFETVSKKGDEPFGLARAHCSSSLPITLNPSHLNLPPLSTTTAGSTPKTVQPPKK